MRWNTALRYMQQHLAQATVKLLPAYKVKQGVVTSGLLGWAKLGCCVVLPSIYVKESHSLDMLVTIVGCLLRCF